ncbi:DUF2838 domain-containing protein [archaeon]|nr:MAG: DUF2838 domain-containing protein [archaeon]
MTESSKKGKLTETIRRNSQKIQAKWRKIVTGNEKKRIRDHLREAQQQPQYVKLMDKLGFTMGVLNITACQYFLLNIPEYFPVWYAVVLPVLLISRLYHFRSQNWHYFLLDFCYFVILCTLLNITVLRSDVFFKMCFIFATGSLPIAIPVWRNSLIFHDYDKIVSVYVHILPCMLYYTLRWHADYTGSQCLHTPSHTHTPSEMSSPSHASSYLSDSPCPPLCLSDYVAALLLYFAWQVMYILKTEVWDKLKLDSNPDILTSLRWMAKDTKNATARSVLKICRRIGVFGMKEEFNSTSMKTKLVFVSSQLVFTMVSFIPSYIVYHSRMGHLLYIGLIFTISVFNGASFYIEVSSHSTYILHHTPYTVYYTLFTVHHICNRCSRCVTMPTFSPWAR